MSDTAFETRDATLVFFESGQYELGAVARSTFWFLLWHRYNDPTHPRHGYALRKVSSINAICRGTGFGRTAVKIGLKELETEGFIERTPQFGDDGRQTEDDIFLKGPDDFNWCCRHRNSHADWCPTIGRRPGDGPAMETAPPVGRRRGPGRETTTPGRETTTIPL